MHLTYYNRLFEPLDIRGKLTVSNRLVMAPMTTVSGNADGSFSDAEIAYLERRAATGLGLVMTPASYVHKSGHAFDHQVGCDSDAMLPSMTRCAEAINRHGAASFLQIHHGGNAAPSKYTGRPPMAPSAVINRRGTTEMPEPMTEDEIWMIIKAFGKAAGRAREAGFMGVEIHGANTYLLQQFFSPFTNRRTDKWGGDLRCDRCDRHEQHTSLELCHRLENRARFAMEVIKAIRQEVGPDYPVSYRISPEEPEPLGYSTHDAVQLLGLLVPLGLDIVHVSSWQYGTGLRYDWHSGTHPTKMISDAMPDDVPVIGVGTIMTPEDALRVLDDGVELVALGRVLLLDPDWVMKARAGKAGEIKTALHSEAEREDLAIPEPMKEYTKRSIQVSG